VSSAAIGIAFISIQITALGFLFNHYLGLSYEVGAIIGCAFIVLYSIMGGIRAVVFTDLLQFLIFFLIFPLACGLLYYEAGGYTKILTALPETHTVLYIQDNLLLTSSYLFLVLIPAYEPPYIQRLLVTQDRHKLHNSFMVVALLTLIFFITMIAMALMLRATNPNLDPNLALYHFVDNYVIKYAGMKGMMIIALLSIIMSSADSWLNTTSSMFAHDVLKKIFKNKISEKNELLFARVGIVLIGLICTIIALRVQQIIEVIFIANNIWIPITFVPLIAGFLRFKTNTTSFIVSIVCAISFCLIGAVIASEFGVISMFIGTLGSIAGFFGAHYIQVKLGLIARSLSYNKKKTLF
jgi:SSS family solute:Na+ symporter